MSEVSDKTPAPDAVTPAPETTAAHPPRPQGQPAGKPRASSDDWDADLAAWEESFPAAGEAAPQRSDELLFPVRAADEEAEPTSAEGSGFHFDEVTDEGVPRPALFGHEGSRPGIPSAEAETAPLDIVRTALSVEIDIDEATPGPLPQIAATPAASSDAIVIPDVAELTASAGTGVASAKAPPEPDTDPEGAGFAGSTPATDASAVREGRALTSDGLPEISGFYDPDTLAPIRPAGRRTGDVLDAPGHSAYELPLTEEPAVDLATLHGGDIPAWPPHGFTNIESRPEEGSGIPVDDTRGFRDLCAEELSHSEAAATGESPARRAALAVAAGRACERLGDRDGALGFYARAIVHEPHHMPALRGRLRLEVAAGTRADAGAVLTTLAQAAVPDERPGYRALAFAWSLVRGKYVPATPNDAWAAALGAAAPFIDAERAARANDAAAASRALVQAGGILGGAAGAAVLMAAARFAELAHDDAGARAIALSAAGMNPRPAVPDPAQALLALRLSARQGPPGGAAALEQVRPAWQGNELESALLRWAARLARAAGDRTRAAQLLAEAQAKGRKTWLPWRDLLDLLEAAGAETVTFDAASLPAAVRALVALRVSRHHLAKSNLDDALAALEAGALDESDAIVLGLGAETLAGDATSPAVRERAFRLWAERDGARSGFAHLEREQILRRDLGDETGARNALAAAVEVQPRDPGFWQLSWRLAEAGQATGAAAVLADGAQAWNLPGAEPLAAALRERATEIRFTATKAADAVRRQAVLTRVSDAPVDHPAALMAELLHPKREPAELAQLMVDAAEKLPHLWPETLGWLVHANDTARALALLQEKGAANPGMTPFVRRLLRAQNDLGLRARVLDELGRVAGSERERAALAFQRAETLEMAGQRASAAAVYRDLLAGPLVSDADLGLRRVLWSLRDGTALAGLFRDEAEGHMGAGQGAAAATAFLDQARARHELLGEEAGAREALLAASEQDPASSEIRLGLLLDESRRGDLKAVAELLDGFAHDFPPLALPARLLAVLIDEAKGGVRAPAWIQLVSSSAPDPLPQLVAERRLAWDSRDPGDPSRTAALLESLADRLAKPEGADPRLPGTLWLRAAELRQAVANQPAAEAAVARALQLEPRALPALLKMRHLQLARGDWHAVVATCEAEAAEFSVPSRQTETLFFAARIALDKLGDRQRAIKLLRLVWDIDPGHRAAFDQLRALLVQVGDDAGLVELLGIAVTAAEDTADAVTLRLERALLLGEKLADRPGAKDELRAILALDPQHLSTLSRLAAMEVEDGAYAVAVELYIRQARFERDPDKLKDILLRIGRIYVRRLLDVKLATGAFERVLRLDVENKEALEALSELYGRQNELKKALAVTEQLVERESDIPRRLPFLLRLGGLWEKAGDIRRCAMVLKRAVDENPRSLQAVGELARFHERVKEPQARNVLLDRSITFMRGEVQAQPADLAHLRTIIPLLRWRQRNACSAVAAQLLALFSDEPGEREGSGWALPPPNGRRLLPIVNPALDAVLIPPAVAPGVRALLRLAGPALAKASKPNLKRWGVGRSERVQPGMAARAIIDPLAADLGLRHYEVYVSSTEPRALAVEPGAEPAIILGSELVGRGVVAVRFAAAYALRLIETHFDVLLAGGAPGMATLLAGFIRQFRDDYRHPDLLENLVSDAAARVGKALPRALRAELGPLAAEIATPFPIESLWHGLQEAAARVALGATGDLSTGLGVLFLQSGATLDLSSLGSAPVALGLVDFALSEDYEDLVAALDAVS